MTPHLQRTLTPDLDGLARLADESRAFLTGAGVDPGAVFKVQLGLEEVLRNLAEHAAGAGQVRVAIQVDPERVAVTVEDDGKPFDPRTGPPFDPSQPLEERTGRGMGLHLLRQLMDEIHYERAGAGNRLRLVIKAPAGTG